MVILVFIADDPLQSFCTFPTIYMHVHVVAWNLKTVDLLPKKENKSNSNIDTYMKKVSNFKKTTVQLSVP